MDDCLHSCTQFPLIAWLWWHTPHNTVYTSPPTPDSTCLASFYLPPSLLSYTICPGPSEHILVNLKAMLSNNIAASHLLLFKLTKTKWSENFGACIALPLFQMPIGHLWLVATILDSTDFRTFTSLGKVWLDTSATKVSTLPCLWSFSPTYRLLANWTFIFQAPLNYLTPPPGFICWGSFLCGFSVGYLLSLPNLPVLIRFLLCAILHT